MNEEESSFNFEELVKIYEGLVDTDPRVKLAKIGQLFNSLNQGGIRYDAILDSFQKLEDTIGEIPIFAVCDFLPEAEKNQRYEYLISELLFTSLGSFRYIVDHLRHHLPKMNPEIPLLSDLINLFRNQSNESLVARYCREWIFNTVILFIRFFYD